MRNPEAYAEHGRNDPRHPDQMREHPYDFVSLPSQPRIVTAPAHDSYPRQLYSGTLTLVYRTVTPLHVGSGSFESSAECGLTGSDQPVRGIVRRQGRPVLPGSSWKGALRARFEAITRSRLALAVNFHSRIPAEKIPGPLRTHAAKTYQVKIQDRRLAALKAKILKQQDHPEATRRQLRELSPAESLFGAMGYRGRVHPSDGTIVAPPPGAPLQIAPMESPAPHRLAQPGEAATVPSTAIIEIRKVEGRKFYYDGDVVNVRHVAQGEVRPFTYELVDCVPAGAEITLDVHLETVELAELGALLISAGFGPGTGVLRFGGFKPAGLGKVELLKARASLRQGAPTRSWKRSAPAPLDLDEAIRAAHRSLIDAAALQELHTVTTLTKT